jgi:hypothetical protein
MMFAPDLPRPPAFAALRPPAPVFVPAESAVAARLAMLFAPRASIFRLVTGAARADQGLAGYYRAERPGAPAVFLKVITEDELERARAIEALAAARPDEAPIARLLPGWPREMEGGFFVLAYPFVGGRFANADEADLARVGRGIGRLHRALARMPQASQIREACAARLSLLEARRRALAVGQVAFGPAPQRLARVAAKLSLGVERGGQPLHGDLNPGNILLPLDGADPVVLDLEDARHTFGPPRLDLALAIERFCLDSADDRRVLSLVEALLQGYAATGAPLHFEDGELAHALLFVNLRALCLLAELESRGERRPAEEWRKFLGLVAAHERRVGLIAEIERLY